MKNEPLVCQKHIKKKQMHVTEQPARDGDWWKTGPRLFGDLGTLAGDAVPALGSYVCPSAGPNAM
jgi:hypothetical protein